MITDPVLALTGGRLTVGETDGGGRRVDEETLRYLAGVPGGQSAVSGTSLFPMEKQETLVVSLDTRYYPERIQAVHLELRAYTNGDFHVSYIEDYLGEVRRCRWDRHNQDHNTRDTSIRYRLGAQQRLRIVSSQILSSNFFRRSFCRGFRLDSETCGKNRGVTEIQEGSPRLQSWEESDFGLPAKLPAFQMDPRIRIGSKI